MDSRNSPWRGRRVLVTGCTGFLGSTVTRALLDRGAQVVGLIRDRNCGSAFTRERLTGQFHVLHGRVEDPIRLHTAMAVHEISAVFHLTGSASLGYDSGTAAILRAAALYHSHVPVVTARPSSQLRLVGGEPEVPAVLLGVARFGELFGGGDRKASRVVPRTIAALLAGEPVSRMETPARDFTYVYDAAEACLALAEAVGAESQSHDVEFRSGWELTEAGMAGLVANVFAGQSPELAEWDSPSNPLGWQPRTPFASAVGETIEWYREFPASRVAIAPQRKAA